MADVANSTLHHAFPKGEEPADPNLAVLQRPTVRPGEKIPAGAFSKEETETLRASGAIVDEKEYVSDEERATALSLSGLEAYRAGKVAALLEENPDADEVEINRATGAVMLQSETPVVTQRDAEPVPQPEGKTRAK